MEPPVPNDPGSSANPLLAEDPHGWANLIDALGPASMLVAIQGRLGKDLRERIQAEDIWQETLMHAWRDRLQCKWTDVRGFRRWLLGIADHRIADARDFFNAAKRTSKREQPLVYGGSSGADSWIGEPMRSTPPGRVAVQREQADQMMRALAAVPGELREVLRLRLFEGLSIPEIAAKLAIGESAAKHRYRRGAVLYRDHLHRRISPTSQRES